MLPSYSPSSATASLTSRSTIVPDGRNSATGWPSSLPSQPMVSLSLRPTNQESSLAQSLSRLPSCCLETRTSSISVSRFPIQGRAQLIDHSDKLGLAQFPSSSPRPPPLHRLLCLPCRHVHPHESYPYDPATEASSRLDSYISHIFQIAITSGQRNRQVC